MKKIITYLSIASLFMLALASCAKEQKENITPTPAPVSGVKVCAKAVAEGATSGVSSKTAISDGEGNTKIVSWVAGDAVNVIYGTGETDRVKAVTAEGGAEAKFEFEVPKGVSLLTAVNPFSATATLDSEGKINVVIPADQTGAFAEGNISVSRVAAAPEVQFAFKNMTSFFKVTSTDAEITKFILTAKGEEALAGTLPVSFDESYAPTPVSEDVADASNAITVNVASEGTFYIAVVPGITYSKGVRLDVYKGDSKVTTYDFETETALTLGRSQIANFGTVSLEFIGDGLTGLYATATGGTGKYVTTKPFPYAPGDPIEVHIPGATATMLQNITMYPTLDENNRIYPALPTDFTNAYEMMIRDARGHCYSHMLSINTKKATLAKVWEKNATEMNLVWYNRMRIAADKDKVYILDNVMNYQDAATEIKVLNRSDGSYLGTLAAPSQYLGDINVDDAGNLIVSRYNCMWGCGLLAYVYNPTSTSWDNFIYWASDTTPGNVGERVSVVGNVKQGKAYVYATTNNSKAIYRWTITDGGFQYGPTYTEEFTGITSNWNNAVVRRASVADNSPVYVGVTMGTEAAAYQDAAAYFNELGTTNSIDQANFGPRILNFKTFKVANEEYLAVVYQWSWERYATAFLKIFNITDRARWTMVAASDRYTLDFNTCTEQGFAGGTNYDQSGGIDVVQGENEAFIYVGLPCKGSGDAAYDASNTKVVCYKMTFE